MTRKKKEAPPITAAGRRRVEERAPEAVADVGDVDVVGPKAPLGTRGCRPPTEKKSKKKSKKTRVKQPTS